MTQGILQNLKDEAARVLDHSRKAIQAARDFTEAFTILKAEKVHTKTFVVFALLRATYGTIPMELFQALEDLDKVFDKVF